MRVRSPLGPGVVESFQESHKAAESLGCDCRGMGYVVCGGVCAFMCTEYVCVHSLCVYSICAHSVGVQRKCVHLGVCVPRCVCVCVYPCVLPGERLPGGADPGLRLGSLPEKTRPYSDSCDFKKGWWVWLLRLSPE